MKLLFGKNDVDFDFDAFMVFHIEIYPGQNWFERAYNNLLTIDWQQVIQLTIAFNIMMFGFIGLSFLIEKLVD